MNELLWPWCGITKYFEWKFFFLTNNRHFCVCEPFFNSMMALFSQWETNIELTHSKRWQKTIFIYDREKTKKMRKKRETIISWILLGQITICLQCVHTRVVHNNCSWQYEQRRHILNSHWIRPHNYSSHEHLSNNFPLLDVRRLSLVRSSVCSSVQMPLFFAPITSSFSTYFLFNGRFDCFHGILFECYLMNSLILLLICT